MDEVKAAVGNERGDYKPKTSFEAENGKQGKSAGDSDFDPKSALRSAHHGKQDVVGGDDHEDGGIEGTVAVKADEGSEASNGQGEQQADHVFQWWPQGMEDSRGGAFAEKRTARIHRAKSARWGIQSLPACAQCGVVLRSCQLPLG